MNRRRWILVWLVLLAAAIRLFSLFPLQVEHYYSSGIYPFIGFAQRIMFGWIPFSIGDVFYTVVALWLIRKVVVFTKAVIRKKAGKQAILIALEKTAIFILSVYTLFNLLWGLNYDRPAMAGRLDIKLKRYSVKELNRVMEILVGKLNELDSASQVYRRDLRIKKKLFIETVKAYRVSERAYPFLQYQQPSLKPSIYSYAGNYLGFSGYYNPFSGEAQVNTTIPVFVQPFVSCHEIGHQLGFAKENEANFAGFLSGRASENEAFRYSVYFDMYAYSLSEMFRRDSSKAKVIHQLLKPQVRKDYAAMQAFFSRHQNPLEPLIRKIYGHYLKANDQPAGMRSYSQVVAMLVAYHRKYGSL